MCKYNENCDEYEPTRESCQYHEIACRTYWNLKKSARAQRVLGQMSLGVV